MYMTSIFLLCLSTLADAQDILATSKICKAVPGDPSWPSKQTWKALSRQVGGRLIRTTPIAKSCYPGSNHNDDECSNVVNQWPQLDFETSNPIGRSLPFNATCPPVNRTAGEIPVRSCILGINPVMAVNATSRAHIKSTIEFARKNNVRLVTSGTGHDLLGRSDGFGSLELWLRYYRNNITFQKRYAPPRGCVKSSWKGSAMIIDGVYQWRDVSKVARANNVFVATGGTPSVGAIGGWSQGGGHGPATTYVGWGVDQVLGAEVMLADGRVVTANACEHSDLYRSLRGGGPGYGVVLSMIVKAHENVKVTAHRLNMVPKGDSNGTSHLLDAVTSLLQRSSDLTDGGVGGYGFWYNHYPRPAVSESFSGYKHSVYLMNKDDTYAASLFDPIVQELRDRYQSEIDISSSYVSYADYWSFYTTEIAFEGPQGKTNIMTSRAIRRNQTLNFATLRAAVSKISHAPGQDNSNCILFTGGSKIASDGRDPHAGFHPAWRQAGFGIVTIRVLPLNITNPQRDAVERDMLDKTRVMEEFAPGMGAYMNEADRLDPNFIENFYGKENYARHLKTKTKYDPQNLFYCATCVGSHGWEERSDGPLCKRRL